MSTCVIFGGSGYFGTYFSKFFLENNIFNHVIICDLKAPKKLLTEKETYINCDVRERICGELLNLKPKWIFNLAAICREPGHKDYEFFETNIKGAENVCFYAEDVNCYNIFFTSTMSVYGESIEPSSEQRLPQPITPYGISKLAAELIHEKWLNKNKDNRLVIVRPGVIYGPDDSGNIYRMIRAIYKGYFFIPGDKNIKKSYGYIYGLMDSISFTMDLNQNFIKYNYVEFPTESIGSLATHIKQFLNIKRPIFTIPKWLLLLISIILYKILGSKSPIHPVRVKKVNFSTHLKPKFLLDTGFVFNYDFPKSLHHWKKNALLYFQS